MLMRQVSKQFHETGVTIFLTLKIRNTDPERTSDWKKFAQLLSEGDSIRTQAGSVKLPLPIWFLNNSEGGNTRVICLLLFVQIESRNTILLRIKGLKAQKTGFQGKHKEKKNPWLFGLKDITLDYFHVYGLQSAKI